MKIDSADILVFSCLVAGSVLAGLGIIEPTNAMAVITGVLGFAARQVVK